MFLLAADRAERETLALQFAAHVVAVRGEAAEIKSFFKDLSS